MQLKKELYIIGIGSKGETILEKFTKTTKNIKCLNINGYPERRGCSKQMSYKYLDLNGSSEMIMDNLMKELHPIENKKIVMISGLGGRTSKDYFEKITYKLMDLRCDFYLIGTIPFKFEGIPSLNRAIPTIKRLHHLHNFKLIDNDSTMRLYSKNPTLKEALNIIDNVILKVLEGVCEEVGSLKMLDDVGLCGKLC